MGNSQHTLEQIHQTINFYRGLMLDLFEQELSDHAKWPFIRSRLLKILSPQRGLEAKIMSIISESDNGTGYGIESSK